MIAPYDGVVRFGPDLPVWLPATSQRTPGGRSMRSRPMFLAAAGLTLLGAGYLRRKAARHDPLQVNDIHSRLNLTRVDEIVTPRCLEELQSAIQAAAAQRRSVCIAGGRHAMGGQPF